MSTTTTRQTKAFKAYAEYVGEREYAEETFDEAYCGRWESEEDFARDLAEDLYPEPPFGWEYFDAEAFARDLFIGDYYYADCGYVFRVL